MTINNQYFEINTVSFPSTKTVEDYKSPNYDQWFLEGYRFQLIDWMNNYDNEENTSSREGGQIHPSTEDLQAEITKLETALTEKYSWSE